jgi:hypothetical protein
MNKRTVWMLVLVLVASAITARAQDKAAAPAGPPAQLSQLAYLTGVWGCQGTIFASPMGPEHATEGTARGAMAIGGRWLHMTYDEKAGAANPTPAHFGMYFGFDSALGKLVESCFDSFGGYCTQFSSGWNNDTLIFEGTQASEGQKLNVRDTFIRKGPAELVHYSEIRGEGGKWLKTDEETCKKTK